MKNVKIFEIIKILANDPNQEVIKIINEMGENFEYSLLNNLEETQFSKSDKIIYKTNHQTLIEEEKIS